MKSSYNVAFDLKKYIDRVEKTPTILYIGKVTSVIGLEIVSQGPRCVVGEICTIRIPSLKTTVKAEVVGVKDTEVHLSAFGETRGIEVGCDVVASGSTLQVPVGKNLLGRIINSTGSAADGKGDIVPETYYPAIADPPSPMNRRPIVERITTGVRAVDTLLTVGKGQRMGIFAGTGVGKTTLLATIAKNTNADVNVIALIGERGREVLDFINEDLGEEGLKKSVVIVATSDEPAISRLRASYVATAVAEYFRDQGKDVMMMFDSVTRFAQAQREIGLANGEPPALKGYPPTVFDLIPKLMERTGTNEKGSITAFYTVKVDGDDFNEPITDNVRGTIDGHIILSRKLADQKHYPAIDVPMSVSRRFDKVNGPVVQEAANKISKAIAIYAQNELMITTGAYQGGTSSQIDYAIEMHDKLEDFLMQKKTDKCKMNDSLKMLSELSGVEIPPEEYDQMTAIEEADLAGQNEAQSLS